MACLQLLLQNGAAKSTVANLDENDNNIALKYALDYNFLNYQMLFEFCQFPDETFTHELDKVNKNTFLHKMMMSNTDFDPQPFLNVNNGVCKKLLSVPNLAGLTPLHLFIEHKSNNDNAQ